MVYSNVLQAIKVLAEQAVVFNLVGEIKIAASKMKTIFDSHQNMTIDTNCYIDNNIREKNSVFSP